MSKQNKIIYFVLSLVFFVIFDLYLSNAIILNIDKVIPNSVFDIVFVQNEGAAFNLLDGSKIFLICFSIFALSIISFYLIRNISKISTLGIFFTSLLSAGICSNMLERILYGYVRDYIKLNFIDFPVFNISDIFINIGVFAIIIIIIKNNYLKSNETDN